MALSDAKARATRVATALGDMALSREIELERQKKLLEDEIGRPKMGDIAVVEETFRRDVFRTFECCRKALRETTLNDYLRAFDETEPNPPLMFDDLMTVEQALVRMREFNISAAPVLEMKGSTTRFVGWHSLSDALHDIVASVLEAQPPDHEIIRETACLSGMPHVHSAWGVLAKHVRTVTSSQRLVGEGLEQREIDLDNKIREWLASIPSEVISSAVNKALEQSLRSSRQKTYSEEDGRMCVCGAHAHRSMR